jgi:glucan phosphorylase
VRLKIRAPPGRLVFLEDYDMNVARYLVQGVDVWMNNPRRPNEASGTSGMKAALNGVLNFSILDGWWHEAYNGRNGWSMGTHEDFEDSNEQDEAMLAACTKRSKKRSSRCTTTAVQRINFRGSGLVASRIRSARWARSSA